MEPLAWTDPEGALDGRLEQMRALSCRSSSLFMCHLHV